MEEGGSPEPDRYWLRILAVVATPLATLLTPVVERLVK